MSLIKVIFSLPIIFIKIVWRFILVTAVSFPISGFFIVPGIMNGETGKLTATLIVLGIIALWLSICTWRKSYENRLTDDWIW